MNRIDNQNKFSLGLSRVLKILIFFIMGFGFLYLINAMQIGSFKNAYGIFGHTAFASLVAAYFIYLNQKVKNNIVLFFIVYVVIFVPNCLMALSNKDIIPNAKDYAREVAETNNLSVLLAVFLSGLISQLRIVKDNRLSFLLRAIALVLSFCAALHFFTILIYVLKYYQAPTFPVILSVFSTNSNEAYEYIGELSIGYYAAIAIALSLSVYFAIKICRVKVNKGIHKSSIVANLALISMVCIGVMTLNYKYASYSYSSTYFHLKIQKYYREGILNRNQLLKSLDIDTSEVRTGLYVLVLGESLNKDHMSLYGYERKTTPWQDSLISLPNFHVFTNVYSCDVFTSLVLPMALTSMTQFNKDEVELEDCPSIVELFRTAGFKVSWISNQGKFDKSDVPQTVIASTANNLIWTGDLSTTSYDDNILQPLEQAIEMEADNHLIIIHLLGSHISYSERYPNHSGMWKLDTETDHYDNSILFNDQLLKKISDLVLHKQNFKALLYISDHGDEIGVGHNTARFTYQMARVPFWIYFSDSYLKDNQKLIDSLSANKNRAWTNDMLFDVMCGLTNLNKHPFYEPLNDIASPQYSRDREPLMIFDKHQIKNDPFYNRQYQQNK